MPLFVVDPARCCRDGICVAECPTRVIELGPDDPTPFVPPEAEERCIRCGHCAAVCRPGAVTLGGIRPDQLPVLRTDWLPGPDQMVHLLRARRSIRSFAARPVDDELLLRLLEAARYAPSASNRQPVSWLIVKEPAEVRRLASLTADWMRQGLPAQPPDVRRKLQRILAGWEEGLDMICRGAPHLLMATAPAAYRWGVADSAIALTYLELAAPAFGLGACWAGFVTMAAGQWPPLREALTLPAESAVCGGMLVGYPLHRYHRLPERNPLRVAWHATGADPER